MAQCAECNEDGRVYCTSVVEQCPDGFLDCLCVGRGERFGCVQRIGVLDWCTVVGTAVGVRQVLRSDGCGFIELCEGTFDLPRYGYVNMSIGIIPVQGESKVEEIGVVACWCVLCVDGIL